MADDLDQPLIKPAIPQALHLANDRRDFRDQFSLFGKHQETKKAGDIQAMSGGKTPAETLIHEHCIRMQFQGEGNGLSLSSIKSCF